MTQTFNIYCDESCHLEKDHHEVMVLGAIWCPLDSSKEINSRLREIKDRHDLGPNFELKWTKVSPAKLQYYIEVMDYFFDVNELHFRALIAPDKYKLQHGLFDQTHDEWHYKMYFEMLKAILDPEAKYRIYLDLKDTRGGAKVAKLRDILSSNMYDFSYKIIDWIQIARSNEIEVLQLCDLLTGTISYANRGLSTSAAKLELVNRMRARSGYDLTRSTLYRERKVNIFRWRPSEINA